ncbi:LEAF RUST 10 DISEASE-RESISTANCE LOCUS RECEPTOR-LIKE PROTEIN KINASE-like 1.2 [Vicia villosa]|uniref:LEAF RUST 10 DISEASE-RESISTANCE LOCUS RECEPTOR-LIKE PROTEIN KINASE-like 1.2 n=1 Tax=Vicia villosa TaxID=3911 RepID=UPI00273CE7C5|nr:LEAF RUST 10 DISEASE-RESISTANCE LOCUS RECEPTOR-LIKE PROTEIN KINASE-like 1.2 [Vicia villosa]
MEKYHYQISLPFSFITSNFIFLSLFFSQFHVTADEMYTSCAPFNCGNFINISYPFWNFNTQPSYCGHPKFMLDCQNGSLTIEIKSQKFHILHMDQASQILRIAREDMWNLVAGERRLCPKHYTNVDIDFHLFNYTSNNEIYTILYECGPLPDSYYSLANQNIFEVTTCFIEGILHTEYIVSSDKLADFGVMKCKNSTTVRGKRNYLKNNSTVTRNVLEEGFEVRWNVVGDDTCHNCIKRGGRCIYKRVEKAVLCLSKESIISKGTWSWKTKLTVGVISSMLATLVIASICIYRRRNNNSSAESYIDSPSISQQLTERISKSQNYGVEHFIFDDLNVATEHFSVDNRLGDGGSGEVFRGKLPDGREVAVKRLFDTGNKQDLFLNEIKILAKVKHDNLVLLYGCTSLKSREPMVVYEYVSNGTLHELLHGDQTTSKKLPWDTRMRIAVETADALKYLHTYKVVHRDVKTSNILLTADCHVKVADFGLSRIFLVDESRVLTTAQGTPGCVDPEYQNTNVLTYKSDVFSFGVVLMELITCLCAYDDISRKGDDIFLYKMAVDRIQNHALTDIVDSTLNFNSDSKENQMINGVADLAVSCLQISSDRPTMAKVFESLLKIQRVNELHPEAASSSNPGDEIKLLNI